MPDRRPPAGPWPVRVGLALVVAAYLAGALFGVAAPFLWGHNGYHGATYMLRAMMTLRFHIITPCNWAGYDYPPKFSWYFHHPIGYSHLLAPFVWLFGPHEWVARAFAAAGGLLLIAALYALVRRHWSREAGLLATAVLVAMPFMTQYATWLDPTLTTIALTLVSLDAFLRYWDAPRRRTLVIGCGAFVAAGLLMWDGYFEAFFLGLFTLALLATHEGRRARLLDDDGAPTRWNAWLAWSLWTGACSAAAMAFHFLFAWGVGMMGDVKASYNQRHAAGLEYVYGREVEWLQVLFGKPFLVAGLAWLAVFAGRAAAGRARRRDLAVWLFLVEKTFYIFLFREAAAVHEYRVDWYLVFLVLAVVDLVADAAALARHLAARLAPTGRAATVAGALAALLASGAWLYLEVPLGYKKLVQSRETMGTDAPNYNADYPKQLFAMEVARRTGPEDFVFTLTTGFPRRIEFYFYMDRSNLDIHSLSQLPQLRKEHPRALLILDPSHLIPVERQALLELLRRHPAALYDGYLVVDLREDKPGVREYGFAPLPMSTAYRYFVSHKYPPMKAVPRTSPMLECLYAELRLPVPSDLPPPAAAPTSADQVACRHNFLLLQGDRAGADRLLSRLPAGFRPASAPLGPGLRVVGSRIAARGGADLWLRVDEPARAAGQLGLRLRLVPDEEEAAKGPRLPQRARAGERWIAAPLSSLPAGWLQEEKLPFTGTPGPYRAFVDRLVPSSATPPPPAAGAAPPPPALPVVAATAELGPVDVR